MNAEEVAIRTGIDNSAIQAGLNQTRDRIKSFMADVQNDTKAAMRGNYFLAGVKDTEKALEGLNRGAMQEFIVLLREAGRGNWSRIPGSVSLLIQRVGLLKYVMNPITGIIAGLVAGFYAAHTLAGALVDRLKGLEVPDFHPEYITSNLQAINETVEAQRRLNIEIDKTVDKYNSAAEAAERGREAIKEHFEHLRTMNEHDKNPVTRAINAAAIAKAERATMLDDKRNEASALSDESKALYAKAAAMGGVIPSKEAEADNLKRATEKAAAAQKYLDGLQNPKSDYIVRGYNAVSDSGVSGADLDAAGVANKKEAEARIAEANRLKEQAVKDEELRKKRADIEQRAQEAKTKSVELALQANDDAIDNAQKDKDADEELTAAKKDLAAELQLRTDSFKAEYRKLINEQDKLQEETNSEGAEFPTLMQLAQNYGPFRNLARNIILAQRDQVAARAYGNMGRAENDRQFIVAGESALAGGGIIAPELSWRSIADNTESTADAISKLLDKAGKEGLNVQAITGQ